MLPAPQEPHPRSRPSVLPPPMKNPGHALDQIIQPPADTGHSNAAAAVPASVMSRRHRVCWWSVSEDDELPPSTSRRSAVFDAAPSPVAAAAAADITLRDASTSTVGVDDRPAAADSCDYSQLNHVVRQSDVLKSVRQMRRRRRRHPLTKCTPTPPHLITKVPTL